VLFAIKNFFAFFILRALQHTLATGQTKHQIAYFILCDFDSCRTVHLANFTICTKLLIPHHAFTQVQFMAQPDTEFKKNGQRTKITAKKSADEKSTDYQYQKNY